MTEPLKIKGLTLPQAVDLLEVACKLPMNNKSTVNIIVDTAATLDRHILEMADSQQDLWEECNLIKRTTGYLRQQIDELHMNLGEALISGHTPTIFVLQDLLSEVHRSLRHMVHRFEQNKAKLDMVKQDLDLYQRTMKKEVAVTHVSDGRLQEPNLIKIIDIVEMSRHRSPQPCLDSDILFDFESHASATMLGQT